MARKKSKTKTRLNTELGAEKDVEIQKENPLFLKKRLFEEQKSKWAKIVGKNKLKDVKAPANALIDNLREAEAKRVRSRRRRPLKIALLVTLVLFVIIGVLTTIFVVIPALSIKAKFDNIIDTSQEILADMGNKNLSNIDQQFESILRDLESASKELDAFSFLRTVPLTKGYFDNMKVSQSMLNKLTAFLEEFYPEIKDILKVTGFTVDDGEIVSESIEEDLEAEENSFALIMAEFPRYLDLYTKMEPKIIDILNESANLNPDFAPQLGGMDLSSLIVTMQKVAKNYPKLSSQVLGFLSQMPELIGATEPTEYLLILQNESEMRASGGLLTSYGLMTLDKGEFKGDISLVDMWNLENYVSGLGIDVGYRNIHGQLTLMLMGCGGYYLRAQDAGIYPDLKWTMDALSDYYYYANYYDPEQFPGYDHIAILDFNFAERLLSLIQPLEVEGFGEVTAETLFDFIKNETDDPTIFYTKERKQIIADIANAAKEKFLNLELGQLPEVVKIFIDGFNSRSLALTSPDPEMQAYFDEYNMSGRFNYDFEGDYFHLNEAQNCSLKLNKFVRNKVAMAVNINEEGAISRGVNVIWEQPVTYRPELEKQYSPFPNYSYRAWVRLFTPQGTTGFSSDGYSRSGYVGYTPTTYFDDIAQKQISDNIIQFDHRRLDNDQPIPTEQLNIAYNLPENLNYNDAKGYKMLIQKHPGKSWGEPYIIDFNHNGQQYRVSFNLDRDKVISYKNGIITVENYSKELDWIVDIVKKLVPNNE